MQSNVTKRSITKPAGNGSSKNAAPHPPQIPAAELFSFLKETRGLLSWTSRDMAKSLHIRAAEAEQALAVLAMQGYVKPHGNKEWLTTLAGDSVSGSRTPRFSTASVEEALAALRERIKASNADPKGAFRIAEAVAFGDFLRGEARAQAADVGVRLVRKKGPAAGGAAQERAFLKRLRERSALLNLQPYQPWMSERSHKPLL
jgi:hypothetical protein